MNHYVPDFEMVDEDYALPPSSSTRNKKSSLVEDDIAELLWENGQVVTQSQNSHRSLLLKKAVPPPQQANNHQSTVRNIPQQQQQLFMQEDEMASWLHYPLNDANFDDHDDLCAALLYPPAAAPSSCTTTAAMRPPVPPQRKAEAVANFPLFSRQQGRAGEAPPRSFPAAVVRESTVVDSSVSPAVCCEAVTNSNTTTNRETAPTSSPGGSSNSAEPPPPPPDRKRKGVDEDLDYQSEDTEFESANPKTQQARGSSSTKRSRAAEVHNLSERRRRDRINEKMRALQELIPRCNKSDKASMLDEAIEYLKSLQLQVQMMSMGCGMMPMMFSGVQQYMSPIGMGLGVGLGMEMGMNRPMMPFPNVLAGASLPMPAAAAAHLGPRFPVPAFHIPPVPTDTNRMQGAPRDPMLNSAGVLNSNQIRAPNFADPYQHYLSLHQMQLPVVQNQATVHPNNGGKPSATQGTDNLDNSQSGL